MQRKPYILFTKVVKSWNQVYQCRSTSVDCSIGDFMHITRNVLGDGIHPKNNPSITESRLPTQMFHPRWEPSAMHRTPFLRHKLSYYHTEFLRTITVVAHNYIRHNQWNLSIRKNRYRKLPFTMIDLFPLFHIENNSSKQWIGERRLITCSFCHVSGQTYYDFYLSSFS